MKNRDKALLLACGSCAISGMIVSSAVTRALLRFAVARQAPRGMEKRRQKSARQSRQPEAEALLLAKSRALEARGLERVCITTSENERLVGYWYPCQNPSRIVIAMHGWRSSWSHDFAMIADFWHEAGCSILFPEQRAHRQSEGEYMTFGIKERYDCLAWAEWVNATLNEEGLPLYLAGISMGATTVLMTGELPLPQNVHGIIADCGFTSPHAIWRHVVTRKMHLSYGLRKRAVERICERNLHFRPQGSTLDAMQKNRLPILFIHGTDDELVPLSMTFENYRACKAPKRLFVVPGAGHGMSYYVDREGYERAVKGFFAEFG